MWLVEQYPVTTFVAYTIFLLDNTDLYINNCSLSYKTTFITDYPNQTFLFVCIVGISKTLYPNISSGFVPIHNCISLSFLSQRTAILIFQFIRSKIQNHLPFPRAPCQIYQQVLTTGHQNIFKGVF